MNTEDRLRNASQDMDRVTASVTAPPVADLRRSARMQAVVVTVATAAAVFMLVGGAVVLFNGNGTTLEPAGPGETTTTTNEAAVFSNLNLIFPDPSDMPDMALEAANESLLYPIHAGRRDTDLASTAFDQQREYFEGEIDVLVLGQIGSGWPSPRAYVLRGVFGENAPSGLAGQQGDCIVVIDEEEDAASCGHASQQHISWGRQTSGAWTLVYGRVSPDARVVTLTSASERSWQPVRDGYFFAKFGPPVDTIEYASYGPQGEVIDRLALEGEAGEELAVPMQDIDASCSGGLYYPSTYPRDDLPEPVVQTLAKIMLFGSRCWFDDLEDVGGDDLTASFGGARPSEYWTQAEGAGERPMYVLMKLLDMPHGTIETEEGTLYVWPSAHAHQGSWETMPKEDVDALRSLYSEADLQGFADFGGYIGYRVGISADGDWSFFVAGD